MVQMLAERCWSNKRQQRWQQRNTFTVPQQEAAYCDCAFTRVAIICNTIKRIRARGRERKGTAPTKRRHDRHIESGTGRNGRTRGRVSVERMEKGHVSFSPKYVFYDMAGSRWMWRITRGAFVRHKNTYVHTTTQPTQVIFLRGFRAHI